VVLVALGFYWGRKQETGEDYFLGGRKVPYWAIAMSVMATQCGVISLIGAPAFVAIASGGGAKWLQYEFAIPIAMILIMVLLVPTFYKAKITTAYEYLEKRFNHQTRALLSFMFLLSRGLATGVTIYAAAVVLSVTVGVNLYLTILLTGVIAIVYTTAGGMKAVIYSDVIQLIVLWGTVFIGIAIVLRYIGLGEALSFIPAERAMGIDFHHTGFDGYKYAFWPMAIGGIFHYFSYYGCDQSQTQRYLCAKSQDASKSSLFLNGFLRFPLVLSYIVFGLVLIGFLRHNPGFLAAVNAQGDPNTLVPMFILQYFPVGLTGLMIAGMFAAAMSSIDSAFNSLTAVTMNDLYKRYLKPDVKQSHYLFLSKVVTVGWGVFCVVFAFFVGDIAETVIEGINMIGSAFYGPILGAFLLGLLSKRTRSWGVIAGVIVGIAFNMYLWAYQPLVSWMWWNMTGFIVTFAVGYLASLFMAKPAPERLEGYTRLKVEEKGWYSRYAALIVYFIIMIGVTYALKYLA
jgi:SSS family solute:Na+ symporter